ncbi:MAG: hypothetical protein ABFS32_09285 [Bacteroidota bacterium]
MKHKMSYLKGSIIVLLLATMGIMAFQYNPSNYEPVFMARDQMEQAVKLQGPEAIEKPGKLWLYNNKIFLIEQYRGIHVIDNTNPENSVNEAFIKIDGCTEVAVKGGVIYTNNAVDLIAIKGEMDFSSIEVVSRNRDTLPIVSSPEPWNDWYFIDQVPEGMIIVRWEPYNAD